MSQKIEVGQVYYSDTWQYTITEITDTCVILHNGTIDFNRNIPLEEFKTKVGLTLFLKQPTTAEILQKLVKDMAEYQIENEIDRYDAGHNDGVNYCIDLINEQLKAM